MLDELPEDDVDRLVIYMTDENVWQVRSRSEGHFRTIDTLYYDGATILCCDCPGGFLGFRRGPCHHVKLVARWVAAHGDQGNIP